MSDFSTCADDQCKCSQRMSADIPISCALFKLHNMCLQALGFAIIAAACIVKMPQIWKIAANKSAAGLSTLSFELEQLALTIFATYGFVLGLPFSAYGEGIVLMLQNTCILAQVYALSHAPAYRPLLVMSLFGAGMAAIAAGELHGLAPNMLACVCSHEASLLIHLGHPPHICLNSGKVTPDLIKVLYDLNNIIVLCARVPQIYQNFKVGLGNCPEPVFAGDVLQHHVPEGHACSAALQSKSTGQLSGATYFANGLGCIARVFTSLQEGGGYAMVRGYLLGEHPHPTQCWLSSTKPLPLCFHNEDADLSSAAQDCC